MNEFEGSCCTIEADILGNQGNIPSARKFLKLFGHLGNVSKS